MSVIYLIGANIKKYRLPGYSKQCVSGDKRAADWRDLSVQAATNVEAVGKLRNREDGLLVRLIRRVAVEVSERDLTLNPKI